jgi:hypothetical protein
MNITLGSFFAKLPIEQTDVWYLSRRSVFG